MIPEERFSSTPVRGQLLNPWTRQPNVSQHWGPVALQDPSQGLLVKLWQLRSLQDEADLLLSSTGVPEYVWYTHTKPITVVSLAFDQNGRPLVAFEDEDGDAFLRWFDPVPSAVVTEPLTYATTPRLTLDDARQFNLANSDVILGYVRAGIVRYRQQRDRFTVEYTPTVGTGGPAVAADILYYIGMNSALRLEWIYGPFPVFHDTPDIMKNQILQQKASAEVLDVTFDFMHSMMFGDTITSARVVITLESGTDASPANMLDGTPTHTTRTVTQTITGGIVGNVYRIAMAARTLNDCVYVVEGLLAINNSTAVAPP